MRTVGGDTHPFILDTMIVLAGTYNTQGKYDEAHIRFEQYLDKMRTQLGDTHPITLTTMYNW